MLLGIAYALAGLVIGFICEAVWVSAVRASNGAGPGTAANWNVVLWLAGLPTMYGVLESNWWFLAGCGVGVWLGSYACVWWANRSEP